MLLWIEELSDIELDRLEHAFRDVIWAHTFNTIPQVGEIRALIDGANAKAFKIKAEESWQHLLEWLRRYYSLDYGISAGFFDAGDGKGSRRQPAPELDAATLHAAKAAGGFAQIESCSMEDLVWRKKEFIADFTTLHETGQVEYLLTDGEARRLLRQIAAGGPQQSKRSLTDGDAATPAAAPAVKPQPTDAEVNQATETARRKIFGGPIRAKTDAELAEELRRQKRAMIERGYLPADALAGEQAAQNG